jgi:hypothetical protein
MILVPPGISGRPAEYNPSNVTQEIMANELALLNLGNFEPLNIHIDTGKYMQEISQFDNDWVNYLPRTDRPNNRKALTLMALPGKSHKENTSLAEASYAAGRQLSELEFNTPTDVYKNCSSLSSVLEQWQPLGRSMIIRSDTGGYFVPHRDAPSMPRECFRLVAFLNNCGPLQYDWLMDDRKMNIQQGQLYYVNTRMTHRTISWVNDSHHLILNIPFTTENVKRVIGSLAHTH